jgi:hypothetical protein
MNTRCSMVVLGALALTAQAFVAHADGTITGLSLNLPAIKTCAVTVNGTGQCLKTLTSAIPAKEST